MHLKTTPIETDYINKYIYIYVYIYILATWMFTAFLGHAANLFYFPQNNIYFIVVSFSVQIIPTFL